MYLIQSSLYVSALFPIVRVVGVEAGSMVPLSVARFFRGGMLPTGVVVVVNGRAVNRVESEGLLALGWVDDEEDLVNSSCKQSLAL